MLLQVSAGGSLANSLVGIAQLAAARERFLAPSHQHISSSHSSSNPSSPVRQRRIRVAMAGCCGGSDALGEFGRAQMAAAGVDMVSVDDPTAAFAGSTTGTVMVFTTPDAQRSFLSSFSSEDNIHPTPALLQAVTKSRLLVIEGYLWELPGAAEVIPAVVKHARAVGTLVVLTAGDASVVQRHGAKVLETIQAGVDMFVSNVDEARALQGFLQQQQQQSSQQQQQQQSAAAAAAEQLLREQQEMQKHSVLLDAQGSANLDSMWEAGSSSSSIADGSSSEGQQVACELAGVCPLVVVTDGSRGSYITALGQLIVVPPYWRSKAPVDTCGAGDAYCGAFLFAFLLGLDLHAMGHLAAKTASAVISRHGPQLLPQDADGLAGVPLGRCTLAAQLMSGGSGSSSTSGMGLDGVQLQALGLGVDASVGAGQLLQGAST
jgi:sugar/nucleoside kinase (ribokinase family)